MVLRFIRKYILESILPPFNQEIFTVPSIFAIQSKMRQQIHNLVVKNDMKMNKFNTNYDQTTRRPRQQVPVGQSFHIPQWAYANPKPQVHPSHFPHLSSLVTISFSKSVSLFLFICIIFIEYTYK